MQIARVLVHGLDPTIDFDSFAAEVAAEPIKSSSSPTTDFATTAEKSS